MGLYEYSHKDMAYVAPFYHFHFTLQQCASQTPIFWHKGRIWLAPFTDFSGMTFIYQEQNASLQSKFHFQIKNIDIFQQRRPIKSSKCYTLWTKVQISHPRFTKELMKIIIIIKSLIHFLAVKKYWMNNWYVYNLKNTT